MMVDQWKIKFFIVSGAAIIYILYVSNLLPRIARTSKNYNSISIPEQYEIKKVLSYCVFGKNGLQRYEQYILSVAEDVIRSHLYRDWTIRIYHEESVPDTLLMKVKTINNNVEFLNVEQQKKGSSLKNGRVWRFLAIEDRRVDISCMRDLDSPLLQREEDAVFEWLKTTKLVHVMRDRDVHVIGILAGMWCFRNYKNRTFGEQVVRTVLEHCEGRNKSHEAYREDDQIVLDKYVFPMIKHDVLQHDSYSCGIYKGSVPYPTKRDDQHRFVGCARPCLGIPPKICPEQCRPHSHKDWKYC